MIERIEIIKGPGSRAYGQNAFTGAINIITKKVTPKTMTLDLQKGTMIKLMVQFFWAIPQKKPVY